MAQRRKTIDRMSFSGAQTATAFLDALLAHFPERSSAIVHDRFGVNGGHEKTLEEIGQAHGITRERVRQIVDVIMKRIKEITAREHDHPLVKRVVKTIESNGGIMPISLLLAAIGGGKINEEKALAALLPSFPGLKIFKETEKHYAIVTLAEFSLPKWQNMVSQVVALLEAADEVQSLEELYALYTKKHGNDSVSKDIFESLLAPSAEIEMNAFGRYGLAHWSMVRPRGTRERAHLILQVMKKPLHFREIARLIDEHGLYKNDKKTHPQTVHNELIKDERFVLVGRGTYALSDWGYRPGTVREVLSSILKESTEPMSREELLSAVMKVRQVKRSTVIINLNSFFTKVGKNIYSHSEKKKK